MQITKCNSINLNSNFKCQNLNRDLKFTAVYGTQNVFRTEGGVERALSKTTENALNALTKTIIKIADCDAPLTSELSQELAANTDTFIANNTAYEQKSALYSEMAKMEGRARQQAEEITRKK